MIRPGHVLSFILILGTVTAVLGGERQMDLTTLLPDATAGWEVAQPDEWYDRESIFRYMNGSGELYLAFDFRDLLVRRYHDASERVLTVELYDMDHSAEAFGIFSRNRSGEEAGIGQGSELHPNHLFFWRDRYFVTVFSEEDFEGAGPLILELGREIAERIGRDGGKPALIEKLPVRDLNRASIRYFHRHTDLNSHYFLSDENILDLGASTEAVLAIYERDESAIYLLLVGYASAEIAASAHRNYLAAYTPEADAGEAVRVEDGTWTVSIRSERHLLAVFDAPGAQSAVSLMSEASARLEGGER